MTADDIKAWAGVVIAAGAWVYTWFTARSKDNAARIDKLEGKVEDHSGRLQAVEQELHHLPDKDRFHGLELAISDIKGQLSAMTEATEAVGRTARRVEDYLLKRSGE